MKPILADRPLIDIMVLGGALPIYAESSHEEKRGIPTFVTWNGLDFTFLFLIERSTALGVELSCSLPKQVQCVPPHHYVVGQIEGLMGREKNRQKVIYRLALPL